MRLREKKIIEAPKSSNGFNPYPEMAQAQPANTFVPGVGFVPSTGVVQYAAGTGVGTPVNAQQQQAPAAPALAANAIDYEY
jgi:hypothetical protein